VFAADAPPCRDAEELPDVPPAVQPDSDALELFAKAWTALVPAFQRREAPTLAPWMEWASEPGPDEPA